MRHKCRNVCGGENNLAGPNFIGAAETNVRIFDADKYFVFVSFGRPIKLGEH